MLRISVDDEAQVQKVKELEDLEHLQVRGSGSYPEAPGYLSGLMGLSQAPTHTGQLRSWLSLATQEGAMGLIRR